MKTPVNPKSQSATHEFARAIANRHGVNVRYQETESADRVTAADNVIGHMVHLLASQIGDLLHTLVVKRSVLSTTAAVLLWRRYFNLELPEWLQPYDVNVHEAES